MVNLYRNPRDERVFMESTPSSSSLHALNSGEKGLETNTTLTVLQCRIEELQLALSKYEPVNIGQLEKRSSKVTFNELEPREHLPAM